MAAETLLKPQCLDLFSNTGLRQHDMYSTCASKKLSACTFTEYLLCAGTFLGAEDSWVNRKVMVPYPDSLEEKMDIYQMSDHNCARCCERSPVPVQGVRGVVVKAEHRVPALLRTVVFVNGVA